MHAKMVVINSVLEQLLENVEPDNHVFELACRVQIFLTQLPLIKFNYFF